MKRYVVPMLFLIVLFMSGCSSTVAGKFVNNEVGTGEAASANEQQQSIEESNTGTSNEYQDVLEEQYDKFMEKFSSRTESGESVPFVDAFLQSFHGAYSYVRVNAVYFGIVAIVVGTLIAIFSTKNKGARKFGIMIAIVIPLLLVVIVFGVGWLNSKYIY